jgi:outer membrane receptor protein involved in Fe transport
MIEVRHAVAAALRAAAAQPGSVEFQRSSSIRKSATCAIALSFFGLGQAAQAQESGADTGPVADGNRSVEEVTVTGSRIRRTTDFNTPNPTTVVDDQYLRNLGIVNVGDAIKQLPSNLSTFSPTTTGNSSFFAGSTIANLRGLNPFFGSRTLTLLNNRRHVPTNQGDGVDLNFIPTLLIDRIDIVTGGASAAYGSGAISGVNNVFLNRKLEGGKIELDYGKTSEGDGDDVHAGLAWGSSLFDGRGHFVFGAEHQKSNRVNCFDARDWCREGVGFVTNGAPAAPPPDVNGVPQFAPIVPGMPEYFLASDLRANQSSTTGVFWNTGLQSDAAGTGTRPFNISSSPIATASFFSNGGVPGGDGESIYAFTSLRAPVNRDVAVATFDFEVNDNVTMTLDMSYGKVTTKTITPPNGTDANDTIAADNAFLTPALQSARDAAGGLFKKDWSSQIDGHTNFTTDVMRVAVGFDGRLGDTSWTWDTYYQYGESDREQFVNDNMHNVAYDFAIDAVRLNPADPNSQIVCRVTRDGVTNPLIDPRIADGCVPLNPFGTGSISQEAYQYAFGYLRENLNYKQQVLAANMSGDLFEGFGAGVVQGAVGLEYRIEQGRNISAEELPDYIRTDFSTQYGASFSGDVDVIEGFVETNVPVLKDKPGARLVELNLAARHSQYRNEGLEGTTGEKRTHDITTWKVSGIWDPADWLRFRASQSRDIRAANFRELYYGQRIPAGGLFGYSDFPINSDPAVWSLEGNVNLDPEKADTTTIGFVFTPQEGFAQGFQFAADWYSITIDNAITPADAFRVVEGCREDNIQEFCDLLVFGDPAEENPADPKSNIELLRAIAFNFREYKVKGVDITASHLHEFSNSTLNVRLIGTKMLEQIVQATATEPPGDIAGMTGTNNGFLADFQSSADFVANLSATWTRGPLSITGQVRYVSDGTMDYNGVGPDDPRFSVGNPDESYSDNTVPSYQVFNGSAAYTFEDLMGARSVQLFGVVDNIFDKTPPIATGPAFGAGNGGTNPIFFDTLGRSFRLGVRAEF